MATPALMRQAGKGHDMEHFKVTICNEDLMKERVAAGDQAEELVPGCETWGIIYQPGNQRGQMTRWPNGRGAVCFGGDSQWGDWVDDKLHIDDTGEVYDEDGELVSEETDG